MFSHFILVNIFRICVCELDYSKRYNMEKIVTSSTSIINHFLLHEQMLIWKRPYALLVHTSIINKVENALRKIFTNTDWEMCEHILQIGCERFEMHLINVLQSNKDQVDFLGALFINSQFSFPWVENPTLFIAAADFHILKGFIKRYNLKAYILKIEEKPGYSVNGDHPIKVVSFHQSVSAKLNIFNKFRYYRNRKNQGYLFVTYGLPWQHSDLVRRIRLNDHIYSILPIILRHLGTLNYDNDLNIMDLLSLRLAISDVRDDPSKSILLNYEIDFMIKRVLAKLIENNHLSIENYLIAKNIIPSDLLMCYLVYEFQHLFQTLDIVRMYDYFPENPTQLDDTINLNEEIDIVNKLEERFNVRYCVDGGGFDKMSLSLFVDLIELENVYKIVLDTNYRSHNSVILSKQNIIISCHKENYVNIYLRGENNYNFIEGFTAESNTIRFLGSSTILCINCNLKDYRIFDNLKVDKILVRFEDIKIDLEMLENFQQCAIEPSISLNGCSLESTSRNWQLLNNLKKLNEVIIYEDERTWLSMFEFIFKEIHKSNTNEFQFNIKREFIITGPRPNLGKIELNSIKFAVNEQKSKLEIRCVNTNEVVDLYCRKCEIDHQEEKFDYEFYE